VKRLHELARKHPRFGYRRMTALLVQEGWAINKKRVHRVWKKEGLRVPQRKVRRRRLGDSANSCTRRAAEYPNHVWSYDFLMDQTEDGGRLKIMAIIDEFTRECVALVPRRSFKAPDVVEVLRDAFGRRGTPAHIRSDNGSEFVAEKVRTFLKEQAVAPLFIAPGSPWENGYCESFNSRFRDELLDRELFMTLREAEVLMTSWAHAYDHERPHGALGYLTPAAFAKQWKKGRPHSLTLPPPDLI
jgi:putative transposase